MHFSDDWFVALPAWAGLAITFAVLFSFPLLIVGCIYALSFASHRFIGTPRPNWSAVVPTPNIKISDQTKNVAFAAFFGLLIGAALAQEVDKSKIKNPYGFNDSDHIARGCTSGPDKIPAFCLKNVSGTLSFKADYELSKQDLADQRKWLSSKEWRDKNAALNNLPNGWVDTDDMTREDLRKSAF